MTEFQHKNTKGFEIRGGIAVKIQVVFQIFYIHILSYFMIVNIFLKNIKNIN